MNYQNDFAVFILSHNRVKSIHTLDMLRKAKYNGEWFVVISTDNQQIDEYKKIIPKQNLLIFNKEDVSCDTMITSKNQNRNASVYARNFIVDYVKNHTSYKYFLMADDDIKKVVHKVDYNGKMKEVVVTDINEIFINFISYLECSDVLSGISPAFGAAFFGGVKAIQKVTRESFQFVVLKVSRLKPYIGFREEDTLLSILNFENIYLSFYGLAIVTPLFSEGEGGVDYCKDGTLSPPLFNYTARPTAIKVTGYMRKIRYNKKMYPCIISEKHKKITIASPKK